MIPARGGIAAMVFALRKILGSDSHCVLGRWLEWQYAGAKQFDAGSAIHGALQCLEPVDLAFGLAIAPWLGDRVLHRRQGIAHPPSGSIEIIFIKGLSIQAGSEPILSILERSA